MKKLNFNFYLVSELSKVLHTPFFDVVYVYRHHNKPSILITPLLDDSDAMRELKALCSSSKSLGHRYVISLEHITYKNIYFNSFGDVSVSSLEKYELTMPNNPCFKEIVFDLEHLELDNFYSLISKKKKGGVK